MKILQVHHNFRIKGGAEKYFFDLAKLLQDKGHQIAFFSTDEKNRQKSPWGKYFLPAIDYEDKRLLSRLRWAQGIIYSREAKKRIARLLEDFQPDLVHLHDLTQYISPSILSEIKNRKIPIVQSVHDYSLLSPQSSFFHNGQICESTKKGNYFRIITHHCLPLLQSTTYLSVIGYYFHSFMNYNSQIDYFITPSNFLKKKLIEYSLDRQKIIHLPLFTACSQKKIISHKDYSDYILYFGRLVPEKGLDHLILAVRKLPEINLKIVGCGITEYTGKLLAMSKGMKNIEFLGFQQGIMLQILIDYSRFTVLPSIWYEVFGISILESFARSKPVVASNIGGISEIVNDGQNGLLFEAGNVEDLTEKISKLWQDKTLCLKLGENARRSVIQDYGPEKHYINIMKIYKMATDKHHKRKSA